MYNSSNPSLLKTKFMNKTNQPVTLASMKRIGDIIKETTQKHLLATLEMAPEGLEKAGHEPVTPASVFAGRAGYDPSFLPGWEVKLPMPIDIGVARELKDGSGVELKYHHFSVLVSKERRMPMLTAVNINGSKSQKISRISTWSYDGRLEIEHQLGDEVYDNNALDRGHMVRREDPIWGDASDAKTANSDTFHFTNSCPQMAPVNQKTWLGLENYVLQNARADGMMISVFTGPYFSDGDLEYRGAKVPLAFWKVIAFLKEDGSPSATAYKVSQEKELAELEFVYAGYKTYQISVQQVIDNTGIDFSALAEFDGFSNHERSSGSVVEEKLESLDDVRI
jgi:endonuclease G, mitochondrial